MWDSSQGFIHAKHAHYHWALFAIWNVYMLLTHQVHKDALFSSSISDVLDLLYTYLIYLEK